MEEKVKTIIKEITVSLNLLPDKEEFKMLDSGKCVTSAVYAKFVLNIYSNLSNLQLIPHPLLSIYYINNLTPKSHCTGIIRIIQNIDKTTIIRKKNEEFMIEKNNVYTIEFKQFAEELKSQIEKSSCKMTTFMYNISAQTISKSDGHANLIFAFKNENMIELVVYDPQGSNPYESFNPMNRNQTNGPKFYDQSNYLVQSLQNVYPKTFRNKGRHMISCPRGLQTHGYDNTGLCLLYSLFFLSCVLQVSKEVDIVSNLNQLNIIEHCIINSFQPEELQKIVVKFSLQLFTFHYEKCRNKIKDFDEIFNDMAVQNSTLYKKNLIECHTWGKEKREKRKKTLNPY
jgi:hypothetical protein